MDAYVLYIEASVNKHLYYKRKTSILEDLTNIIHSRTRLPNFCRVLIIASVSYNFCGPYDFLILVFFCEFCLAKLDDVPADGSKIW